MINKKCINELLDLYNKKYNANEAITESDRSDNYCSMIRYSLYANKPLDDFDEKVADGYGMAITSINEFLYGEE